LTRFVWSIAILLAGLTASAAEAKAAPNSPKISYYKDVRPILQANCQGCHQPAKEKGGYVMTDFKRLLQGGDTEGKAIVAAHPDQSSILKMVTPMDGEIRMPKGKTPLNESEIATLKTWIEQGALDDTPTDSKRHYDAEHPPIYSHPPVISSLDFQPNGKLLAVAGFHEVLLYDDAVLAGRLIGLSERVQSIRFSPDGKLLAVGGGDPARLGEIQVWDVVKKKLLISAPISYDTVYGVSWSPDSKLIAFGCADNTVRALEAATGKQVVQMGSHSDWPLSTTFSIKGDHIISGGRDMSVKLTEVAAQRFVDNVTSITPGALKGGVLAVDTHPKFEEIVAGGSDGLPKVYRIFREVKREIGDDAQFIGDLFPVSGRVFSLRFSPDGKRIACGSGLDRAGEVVISSYDYTNEVPKALRDLMGKVPGARKPEEQKQLEEHRNQGIHEIARAALTNSAIYSVAFNADGTVVAAGGSDGKIRFINATNGTVIKEFAAVPLTKESIVQGRPSWAPAATSTKTTEAMPIADSLPEGAEVTSLEIQPDKIKLASPNEYSQLLVTAHLKSGDTADVTRLAKYEMKTGLAEISSRGLLRPIKNGTGRLAISVGKSTSAAVIEISGMNKGFQSDFIRDVGPVLSHLGCNAGTCHGAKEGKNGFKLSLRGYDPETDLRALTDDLASRRVNVASPDDSLILLKAVAEVPHEGGRRVTVDDRYYQIMRQWIANGATLDMKSPRVTKIEIFPQDSVVQKIGSRQQMRVVASYSDGKVRDVTAEAFLESGNTDVAATDAAALITTLRRGEAPILARYEGNYAATTLTVMGDRSGFVWKEPESWGKIDELVAAKWKRMKIEPSGLCSDLEFIRRVYLDLTGLPPSPEEIRAFADDKKETRLKRDELVDHLVGSSDYVDFWANKWADLLQCNSKFLGSEGAELFRNWIRKQVEGNTSYDKFAREILTASGSTKENPAASYWKIVRTPTEAMENTTQLFLATRFNCNKCHDHPFERWTQDQYYQTAAYFARVSLKEDPASAGKKVGGSNVESAKPLYEVVGDAPEGEVKHDRTGKVTAPKFPFPAKHETKEKATRREDLATWITSPDNRFFASSYANRLWGYLTGAGVIEPLDDTRAGNPARNLPLLEHLTQEFVSSGFDPRHMMKIICKSRAYQLSIRPNQWNEDDKVNYSHALARRLPAETLFDAVFRVTGCTPNIPGTKPGMRASQLADGSTDVGSGLLATLGRPARQSACECERSSEIRLGSVMALLSGPTISEAINEPTNSLAKLVQSEKDDTKLVNEVFMRILNRPASESEIKNTLGLLTLVDSDNTKITNELSTLEGKLAPAADELKKQRDEAIAHAKASLATYDDLTKGLKAQLETRRQSEISMRQEQLRDYERLLPAQAAFSEVKNNLADTKTVWMLVEPQTATASNGIKLAKKKDGSLLATGGKPTSDYKVKGRSDLAKITGVMVEVLPEESLPNFGPGRSGGGNFVLSELQLKWGAGTNAPQTMAKFVDAKADFSQTGFTVNQAIDGVAQAGANGWAIYGAPGIQRHTATFKLEHPIAERNGVALQFVMQQLYGENHMIAHFRLYVTASDDPLDFGLPEKVLQAVRAPAGERKPEQTAAFLDYYRNSDAEFWKRKLAAVKASEPLPADPKFTELQAALSTAEQPIKLDPTLVQLRQDAQDSGKQVHDKRLTVAQDLAWALINSSGFLFNH
jgi:WD40 repeat protein